jgi:hypothetical protein
MVSYLQDTNAVEVYNGTAWVGVSGAGDVTEVQAGVGISVASGTGPIPVITNSSTDLITTAGDLLYGTAADTVARLGIGTAGQVLKVNSGATAPEWGAASSGFGNYADYTPTYSSFTLGNGTVVAKQAQSNNTVHTYGRITLGSTSSVSGAWEISLPTAVAFTSLGYQGFCSYLDASASLLYVGWMNFGIGGGAVFRPRSLTASQIYAGDVGATTPFTWTTSDILYWNVIYAKA